MTSKHNSPKAEEAEAPSMMTAGGSSTPPPTYEQFVSGGTNCPLGGSGGGACGDYAVIRRSPHSHSPVSTAVALNPLRPSPVRVTLPPSPQQLQSPPAPVHHQTIIIQQQQQPAKVVVVGGRAKEYRDVPVSTVCSHCLNYVTTNVETKARCGARCWSLLCCLTGVLALGCCLIPFCCRCYKVTLHHCPECRKRLAKHGGCCSMEGDRAYF